MSDSGPEIAATDVESFTNVVRSLLGGFIIFLSSLLLVLVPLCVAPNPLFMILALLVPDCVVLTILLKDFKKYSKRFSAPLLFNFGLDYFAVFLVKLAMLFYVLELNPYYSLSLIPLLLSFLYESCSKVPQALPFWVLLLKTRTLYKGLRLGLLTLLSLRIDSFLDWDYSSIAVLPIMCALILLLFS